jgi:hypothetical protein
MMLDRDAGERELAMAGRCPECPRFLPNGYAQRCPRCARRRALARWKVNSARYYLHHRDSCIARARSYYAANRQRINQRKLNQRKRAA